MGDYVAPGITVVNKRVSRWNRRVLVFSAHRVVCPHVASYKTLPPPTAWKIVNMEFGEIDRASEQEIGRRRSHAPPSQMTSHSYCSSITAEPHKSIKLFPFFIVQWICAKSRDVDRNPSWCRWCSAREKRERVSRKLSTRRIIGFCWRLRLCPSFRSHRHIVQLNHVSVYYSSWLILSHLYDHLMSPLISSWHQFFTLVISPHYLVRSILFSVALVPTYRVKWMRLIGFQLNECWHWTEFHLTGSSQSSSRNGWMAMET